VQPQREQIKKCLLAVGRARIQLYQFRIQLAILIVGSGNSCKANWVVENCEGWMAYSRLKLYCFCGTVVSGRLSVRRRHALRGQSCAEAGLARSTVLDESAVL
jgi:hypothetical protein